MKYIRQILSAVAICSLLIAPAALSAQGREIIFPAGTAINVRMIDSISSSHNQPGQIFRASLADPIRVGREILVPRGADAFVRLVNVNHAGRVEGRSELMLQLERIQFGNERYYLVSNVVDFRGRSEGKNTARNTGIGAAVGGGLGALFGGGTGAAIGAGLGGGAAFAGSAAERGRPIMVPSESLVSFQLMAPLRIQR
jgi:hypothetical protein